MPITTVLSIVSGLIGIVKWFLALAEQKRWMDAGAKEAILRGIEDADKAVGEAKKARERVRADLTADPSGVRKHDEFERPD